MDWKTRLAIKYKEKNGMQWEVIRPIDSFSPSFNLASEPLHSVEETHLGVIYSPQSITFSMTVKAVGDVVGKLTRLALEGTRFDIMLDDEEGDDWSFKDVVLSDCIITSATPTTATISGAPAATFSGFSLSSKATPSTGAAASIP